QEQDSAHKNNFDQSSIATEPLIALPPGWQGNELVMSLEASDPVGGATRYRAVVAGKSIRYPGHDEPSGMLLVAFYIPETIARAAPQVFPQMIASLDAPPAAP